MAIGGAIGGKSTRIGFYIAEAVEEFVDTLDSPMVKFTDLGAPDISPPSLFLAFRFDSP